MSNLEIIAKLRMLGNLIPRPIVQDHLNEFRSHELDNIIGSGERTKIALLEHVLKHRNLKHVIRDGYLTLGAVKPHTELCRLGVETDLEGTLKTMSLIEPPLEVLCQLSMVLNQKDIESFYAEAKGRIGEGWEGFVEYMQSGPITYFLLFDPTKNAIENWRNQMGATNPIEAEVGTIRQRYALSRQMSLVHGSTSTQDAINEIKWLASKVQSFTVAK